MFITEADAVSTSFGALTLSKNQFPESIYVLPGKHTLKLLWGNGFVDARGLISFESKPGISYTIRQSPGNGRVKIWIEVSNSHEIIGYVVPEKGH
jgi:hypothetical protein